MSPEPFEGIDDESFPALCSKMGHYLTSASKKKGTCRYPKQFMASNFPFVVQLSMLADVAQALGCAYGFLENQVISSPCLGEVYVINPAIDHPQFLPTMGKNYAIL